MPTLQERPLDGTGPGSKLKLVEISATEYDVTHVTESTDTWWQSVERGAALGKAQHLLTDAFAEISRKRYALATIAHGIINALVLT